MKSYSIIYQSNYRSGSKCNHGVAFYADDKPEALAKWDEFSHQLIGAEVSRELVSIDEKELNILDHEFMRGTLSTVGD